jgi:hypothetical protein
MTNAEGRMARAKYVGAMLSRDISRVIFAQFFPNESSTTKTASSQQTQPEEHDQSSTISTAKAAQLKQLYESSMTKGA